MPKVLTQRRIDTVKPSAKRYSLPDGLIPSLNLIVHPTGAKSYRAFPYLAGKQINLTIGNAALMTLAQARAEARRQLGMVAQGVDPRLAKRAAPVTTELFEPAARRFIERYLKPHNRSWGESARLLVHDVIPRWGNRPIDGITRQDVAALLDAIADRAPIVANRVLGVLRRMFNWLIERGLLETSPCDRVRNVAPEAKRDRVHSDRELALIFQAAGVLGYPYGTLVQLLALTGARLREVAELRWSELDPELTTWVLPSARSKNGIQHEIPIVPAVQDILAGLPRFGTDFVFTTNGTRAVAGFSLYKRRLDRTIASLNGGMPLAPWRQHDLRRSTASGMARLGTPLAVIERVLNHRSGTFRGVVSVYQHYDYRKEMQAALTTWSEHVLGLQP